MKKPSETRRVAMVLLATACFAGLAGGQGLVEGQTRAEVLATMGEPEREVESDRGSIMFFGRTLIELEDGRVSYVSVTPKRVAPAFSPSKRGDRRRPRRWCSTAARWRA